MAGSKERSKEDGQDEGTPLLEWVASSIGALFALGIVGFVLWDALGDGHSPVSIRIEVESVRSAESGTALDFAALNEGGSPAAEVVIGTVDGSEQVTFDFIPAQSRRKGTIVMPPGSNADAASLRVLGYREP